MAVTRTGNAVDLVVGGHHGEQTRLGHLLEGWQNQLVHLIFTDVGRSTIVSTFGPTVGRKVLDRRNGRIVFIVLHASHNGCTHLACQERIFTKSLFHTRPTRVTCQVDDGTVADMGSLLTDLHGLSLSHLLEQFRIPGRGLSDGCREGSRTDGHVTMRTLFRQEHGNTQTGLLDAVVLQQIAGFDGIVRVQTILQCLLCPRIGTHESPQRTCAMFDHHLLRLIGQRDLVTFARIERPAKFGQQLACLLLQRHLLQEILHPIVQRGSRILVNILGLILIEINPSFLINLVLFAGTEGQGRHQEKCPDYKCVSHRF